MRTHLTWEEIEKYRNVSDLSEEYLLWMEAVSAHLDVCEICQKRIQKAIVIEEALEEDNFKQMLKLAEREEEIRRNIVICKLHQMSQDDHEKTKLQQMIQKLQRQTVQTYILQVVQTRAGVSRGEEILSKKEKGLEISYLDHCLQVQVKANPAKSCSVVFNREEKAPQIAEAVWKKEKNCFVAEFEIEDTLSEFEIYIVEN